MEPNLDKSENLRNFFAAPVNQTTRERIFFSRLSFDLKIAAARNGYHLHLYEPDVDRDGFDIVVEDEDVSRWFQTKAVLASAATTSWEINAGLLWPTVDVGEKYFRDPVQCGRGGGVILIEIDDTDQAGNVVYSYTDYDIITAIAEGFLTEQIAIKNGPGRPYKPARLEATETLKLIHASDRDKKVWVSRKLFIEMSSADALLSAMGMRTDNNYGIFTIRNSFREVSIDEVGNSAANADIALVSALHYHMTILAGYQPTATESKPERFKSFTWVKLPPSG